MEATILTVHWHDSSAPVYSLSYQPNATKTTSERLVSGGGDNNIRVWKLDHSDEGEAKLEYLSTLAKHSQAVNVVRFNPTGEILATAGDDGMVLLWNKADSIVREFGQDAEDLEDIKESWTLSKTFRSSSSEVYDLCWSSDSRFIVTGSTDNIVRVYDVKLGLQINSITEHNHFVQGVAFDPRGEYIVSQSADRSIHISTVKYDLDSKISLSPSSYFKISRAEFPIRINRNDGYELDHRNPKSSMLYQTENLESFFRRLTFSPDGLFLFTPSGIYKPNPSNPPSSSNSNNNQTIATDESTPSTSTNTPAAANKEEIVNTVYIYSRFGLNKPPIAHIPNLKKPAIAISFSSIYYEIPQTALPVFKLPYKLVYAVLTQDSVLVFDTTSMKPIGSVSGIHYRTLTDLTWNQDGLSLVVSSADGFCSVVRFHQGVFGKKLSGDYKTLLKGNEENALFSSVTLQESTAGDVKDEGRKRDSPDVFNLMSGASVRKKPKNNTTTVVSGEIVKEVREIIKSQVVEEKNEEPEGIEIGGVVKKQDSQKENLKTEESKPIEIVSLSDEEEGTPPISASTTDTVFTTSTTPKKSKDTNTSDTPTLQKKKPVDIFAQLAAKPLVHTPPVKKKEKKRVQPTVIGKP